MASALVERASVTRHSRFRALRLAGLWAEPEYERNTSCEQHVDIGEINTAGDGNRGESSRPGKSLPLPRGGVPAIQPTACRRSRAATCGSGKTL